MKQKLLLVGNKPLTHNSSEEIDAEFDYIFRVNRMQSLGYSGTRIDGLYITIGGPFFNSFLTADVYYKWIQAKQVYVNNRQYSILEKRWKECVTEEQFKNVKILTFPIEGFQRIIPDYSAAKTPTSVLKLLDYLIYTPEWRDVYDIYVCGLDIAGRGEMMSHHQNWIYTSHKYVGDDEARYIMDEVNKGNLTFVQLD